MRARYWSVEVAGARIGDEYQFVIRNGTQPLIWHKNPYASEVVNSSGNAIIHDPNFDWTGDNFVMPPWMGHPHPRGKETRSTVEVLRKVCAEQKVALADTSKRWEHLEVEGLPYTTLLVNGINHPDDRGHEMFVADLMAFFPKD